MLKEYKISEIKNIKINGRTTDRRDPLTLFWTASGFEVNVRASELWVELEADFDGQEPWFSILIDGAQVSRQMANAGRSRVCLFRRRDPEKIKNVRFVKDSQAMPDDTSCCLQVHALYTDGEFCEVKDRPFKLEIIGDSITSGEGLYGATKDLDWVSQLFSGTESYAALTAEKINADLHVISQSGWGLFASWDGKTECAIPPYYDQICGVLKGDKNISLGCKEAYDFEKWQPDAVVINLGTNDSSAFNNADFDHDIIEFEDAAANFLYKLRERNPHAKLIWIYGMLGYDMALPIMRAIDSYEKESGDKVHYLQMPDTTPERVGSRMHPGRPEHELVADILADFLRRSCGLEEGK